ncbi:MAG: hypothetical protein IJ584_12860 [Bacteroidales bacterium]|nr:hypothetical protein [Bacteroidales bacterium]
MTEYDVRDALERISASGTVIKSRGLPDDWKYIKLYDYFGERSEPKVRLKFTEIEKILGFKLTKSQKTDSGRWYARKDQHAMADAWGMQGYRIGKLDMKKKKVVFEATFEDAERVTIPPEILDHKVPTKAKYEIERYLKHIVKKYGLTTQDVIPRMG